MLRASEKAEKHVVVADARSGWRMRVRSWRGCRPRPGRCRSAGFPSATAQRNLDPDRSEHTQTQVCHRLGQCRLGLEQGGGEAPAKVAQCGGGCPAKTRQEAPLAPARCPGAHLAGHTKCAPYPDSRLELCRRGGHRRPYICLRW